MLCLEDPSEQAGVVGPAIMANCPSTYPKNGRASGTAPKAYLCSFEQPENPIKNSYARLLSSILLCLAESAAGMLIGYIRASLRACEHHWLCSQALTPSRVKRTIVSAFCTSHQHQVDNAQTPLLPPSIVLSLLQLKGVRRNLLLRVPLKQ